MDDIRPAVAALGEAIKNSEEYAKFYRISIKYEANAELQEKIGQFNLLRDKLVAARSEETKDIKLIESVQQQMQEAYAKIMESKEMVEFTEAKGKFDKFMQRIYTLINFELFGQGGCTSDCSTCKGCH